MPGLFRLHVYVCLHRENTGRGPLPRQMGSATGGACGGAPGLLLTGEARREGVRYTFRNASEGPQPMVSSAWKNYHKLSSLYFILFFLETER